jgi:hypothetical protein
LTACNLLHFRLGLSSRRTFFSCTTSRLRRSIALGGLLLAQDYNLSFKRLYLFMRFSFIRSVWLKKVLIEIYPTLLWLLLHHIGFWHFGRTYGHLLFFSLLRTCYNYNLLRRQYTLLSFFIYCVSLCNLTSTPLSIKCVLLSDYPPLRPHVNLAFVPCLT